MTDAVQRFWTPGRIIATFVIGAAIAISGFFLLHSDEGEAVTKVSLPPASPANSTAGDGANQPLSAKTPVDYEIATTDGDTIQLSTYRGKVLVLDFWATWCPPCREEIPQLVRIAREKRDRGVEVVGLHIDDGGRSSPEAIKKFIRQFNINYIVGMASEDLFISYLGEEETTIPQTLVFDRSGKVTAHLIGYDSSHAKRLDEAINKALAN
jgi:thiol-disulfide isomerase/thioredoxin